MSQKIQKFNRGSGLPLIRRNSIQKFDLFLVPNDVKLQEIDWLKNYGNQSPRNLFQSLMQVDDINNQNESCEPNTDMSIQESHHKGQGCKCSKIGCLKLYCECFAKGVVCGKECICVGCQNCVGNQKKIHLAQEMANFRKPGSFVGVKAYVPERKCTCKKSHCKKRYCECHNAGMKCTALCECTECYNKQIIQDEMNFPKTYSLMEIEVEG